MAEPKATDRMEKIVSLCKRRGFIFQSSELYGGINGFWDYGPLGAELKRNVREYWWRCMTQHRDDVVGLEASIIMHPRIWEASGHTSTFSNQLTVIEDDHIPFLRAGVAAADIIDLENPTWHTPQDDLDHVSAKSLQVVGDVVTAAIPEIEKRIISGK